MIITDPLQIDGAEISWFALCVMAMTIFWATEIRNIKAAGKTPQKL